LIDDENDAGIAVAILIIYLKFYEKLKQHPEFHIETLKQEFDQTGEGHTYQNTHLIFS